MNTIAQIPYSVSTRTEVERPRSCPVPPKDGVIEGNLYRARTHAGMLRYAMGIVGIMLGCLLTWAGSVVGVVKIVETIREHLG